LLSWLPSRRVLAAIPQSLAQLAEMPLDCCTKLVEMRLPLGRDYFRFRRHEIGKNIERRNEDMEQRECMQLPLIVVLEKLEILDAHEYLTVLLGPINTVNESPYIGVDRERADCFLLLN
jgi:hypothetical protein